MKTLSACLLVAAMLVPCVASAAPPRNPPPAEDTPQATWYVKLAATAKCPPADPVVGVDLASAHFLPPSDPRFARGVGFACTSAARSHGLTQAPPPAPPPMTFTQFDTIGNGTGGTMQTDVTIPVDGSPLDAITKTHEMTQLHGFHGSVAIVLFDGPTVLWRSDVHVFGVDGAMIGRPDRSDEWHATISPDILARAHQIGIYHWGSDGVATGGGGIIGAAASANGGALAMLMSDRSKVKEMPKH